MDKSLNLLLGRGMKERERENRIYQERGEEDIACQMGLGSILISIFSLVRSRRSIDGGWHNQWPPPSMRKGTNTTTT